MDPQALLDKYGPTSPLTIFLDAVEAALDRDDDQTIADIVAAKAAYTAAMNTPCDHWLYSGPGHQSGWPCERKGDHHDHLDDQGRWWSSCQANEGPNRQITFTDFFDRPPGACDGHPDVS
jgi:hypothetical protein